MLDLSTILKHYKREDVQNEMVLHAKDREFSVMYGEKGFGKRPDILQYPKEILELAKQGATSFHVSEELWKNPLQLTPMLKKSELDNLRIGWDLVLDIDCPVFEYSKIAADLIVRALKHHGINSISAKFSGNKGFHIGVPFESFPASIMKTEVKDIRHYFPEGPRQIALYLKEMVKEHLAKKILEFEKNNFDNIIKRTGKRFDELVKVEKKDGSTFNKLDAESILALDTILISSRHLYRMPYSLHEKSGLVSLPIDPEKIIEFKKEDALPEKIKIGKFRFLNRANIKPNESKELFDKAIYSAIIRQKNESKKEKIEEKYNDEIKTKIPESYFPPCIQAILKGLEDGRKRSMFVLINFLTSVGWNYDEIEKLIDEWNKKNKEPLREVLVKGNIRYHKQQKKSILPPNCANSMYYKDLQICKPDAICERIKNPVNYCRRKIFLDGKNAKTKSKKKVAESN